MKGTPAVYLGRIVQKKNFRAFVYGSNNEKKVVNSWDEFEAAMQSGIWFASIEDAKAMKVSVEPEEEEAPPIEVPKPKPAPKPQSGKVKEPPQKAKKIVEDGAVFEVIDENK